MSYLHFSDASLHPCTKEHHFVKGCHELKIVSGNSNRALADGVAHCLGRLFVGVAIVGTEVMDSVVTHFNDGETSVQLKESVRGKDVYIVGSSTLFKFRSNRFVHRQTIP